MRAVHRFVLAVCCASLAVSARADEPKLLTVAEKSDYTKTSRHAEVIDYCEALAKRSPLVDLQFFGKSHDGKKLPLLVVADPPLKDAAAAKKSGKPVVLVLCNIHAGEVAGKEGVMMLVRDLTLGKKSELLKKLVVLIAPDFNADGNDKMAKDNRPGQLGPEQMGIRANAQGFDLNRDFIKLESPEVRALVGLFNEWDPHVFLDMHTTNGSRHRYTLTYDGPRHPATPEKIVTTARDVMLPAIGKKLEKRSGYKSFYYGNFARDLKGWVTYPALPRYGIAYVGLRNRISILSEAYSYATYKDRVLASRDFAHSCLEYAAENEKTILALLRDARATTIAAGRKPRGDSKVPLRFQTVPLKKTFTILGYEIEIEQENGRFRYTKKPKEHKLPFVGLCMPTVSVTRPYAYLIPKKHRNVVENLQRHGIVIEELREDVELDVEEHRIDKITKSLRVFQKHRLVSVKATARKKSQIIEAGTLVVRTGQPLGTLASFLLEPQSDDGLVKWNFFDDVLKEGGVFPVLRLPQPAPLIKGPARSLSQHDGNSDVPANKKRITLEDLRTRRAPSFSGTPTRVTWLDDEHFLQRREGKLYKVQARTGRSSDYLDEDKLVKALTKVRGVTRRQATAILASATRTMDRQQKAFRFSHRNDLYVCHLADAKVTRVTKTPNEEEALPTFSPDGEWIAFVRKNNLYVVDLATQTEKQLTKDGSELIFNGRADWVYYEEVFLRNRNAYWWSPSSKHVAFLRFDDNPVPLFTVIDQFPLHQRLEQTRYPKAGDPNPLVKLGIIAIADGKTTWAQTKDYDPKSTLIVRAGWFPKGERAYFCVQDRAQTWLDFCAVAADASTPTRLFREKSKAWVDVLDEPTFLKDGSFVLLSERSGWKHLYHFEKDGTLRRQITNGMWEVRRLHHVDQEQGWIYFSGTKTSHLGARLYRAQLDGSRLTELVPEPGSHRPQMSPNGKLFVDTWSNLATPTKVMLRDSAGKLVRRLDLNPVHERETYHLVKQEPVQIKAPDGFVLEATMLKPPHFDAARKYPVWLKTYAGPHSPTVSDSWRGGRVTDQALATMGFVVFYVDPRSASGKGAESAWTAHRQLGVQELKDLETAVKWLIKHPWVDAKRIGMSGSSYGGFMTAYAMTHSKLFAAGVASAPVTDWRYYDTIYTERYMGTPKDNPGGYDKSSVVKAAKNLHGRLLIVHGLMDDNVHPQNTLQFIDQLQRANKEFELMIYPRSRHGGFGRHFSKLSVDFMRRALRP